RGRRGQRPLARRAARRGDGGPAGRAALRAPRPRGGGRMRSTTALPPAGLLLAATACVVGAELAVISGRRAAIEARAAEGIPRAQTVLWAMENVSLMLACAQLGVTICSTGLGVVAEPALAHLIEDPLHALGVSTALAHPIAFVVALAVVVYLH